VPIISKKNSHVATVVVIVVVFVVNVFDCADVFLDLAVDVVEEETDCDDVKTILF